MTFVSTITTVLGRYLCLKSRHLAFLATQNISTYLSHMSPCADSSLFSSVIYCRFFVISILFSCHVLHYTNIRSDVQNSHFLHVFPHHWYAERSHQSLGEELLAITIPNTDSIYRDMAMKLHWPWSFLISFPILDFCSISPSSLKYEGLTKSTPVEGQ